MKRKSKIFTIILVVCVGLILFGIIALFFLSERGMWISTGRYLRARNGESMIILNDRSPYVMSNDNQKLFKKFDSGDEIWVLHGIFLDSYPGEVGVYAVGKVSDGEISDISQEVLNTLSEMGWIDAGDDKDTDEQQDVSETQEEVSLIHPEGMTLQSRIDTPEGYIRTESDEDSFTSFIRNYALKEDGSPVLLYNGTEKRNQNAHVAVFKLPIENEDLQQCADSVMRMYAEYYYTTGQYDKINFHFVSGFLAEYSKWQQGYRISVNGNDVFWVASAGYDDSYECFQKFMRVVFAYASTLSMDAESEQISIEDLQVGDVFLKGGSPGHVVMVVDICENAQGEKAFLLAQGYMPAQEFHILKNPNNEDNPWYYANEITYPFRTPEYTFQEGSLKRLKY